MWISPKRHNLDPAQMALAFVRRQPFVASTLLGATTMEQLKTNVESLHLELSEEVLAEIEAVHQVLYLPGTLIRPCRMALTLYPAYTNIL